MSTKPPCDLCGHVHAHADVRAQNRFAAQSIRTYRANYDGSPIRATRAEAEADMCQWRQGDDHEPTRDNRDVAQRQGDGHECRRTR